MHIYFMYVYMRHDIFQLITHTECDPQMITISDTSSLSRIPHYPQAVEMFSILRSIYKLNLDNVTKT